MASALRSMGAPEEILSMFGLTNDVEENANGLMRQLETSLTEQRPGLEAREGRAGKLDFSRKAWLISLMKGFGVGETSFPRVAETMATMQLRILELEDALKAGGLEVPFTPEPKAPEGQDNGSEAPEGKSYWCPIHKEWE